ncbi:hypothetical protein CLOSTASPAR_00118 [[Clostridium] asparagiforme DSM 15981]|uniref:Uncharacterized protein n=1 Tax=[Clostridium] asparagiforme DSM 15981 TaxID=518636 RepID=C0CT22_9FIRM|nr:hypothetical protein CLOSTASPAR_00118 [[Clostridium] asparagiforme DSM 15981]
MDCQPYSSCPALPNYTIQTVFAKQNGVRRHPSFVSIPSLVWLYYHLIYIMSIFYCNLVEKFNPLKTSSPTASIFHLIYFSSC